MQLTYRAQTIDVSAAPKQRQQYPHAINWRYQMTTTDTTMPAEMPQHLSAHGINWRYQLPTK